jgi:hypothetical protein
MFTRMNMECYTENTRQRRDTMGTRTLYKEDWFSYEHLQALEDYTCAEFSCAFSSVQYAVQACLELLGARTAPVPVLMSVTAPPDTLAGVLRAGGHPLLIDIDEETLQIDEEFLKDAISLLEEDKNIPVVLLTRPLGTVISDSMLEIIADVPSILDARVLPHSYLSPEELSCTFNIFDLTPVCGTGAVVIHRFEKQVEQLKQVRSGPMGLGAHLSELDAQFALNELQALGERAGDSPVTWVKVPDAEKAVLTLNAADIESVKSVVPLYLLEEVKRRYKEVPEYPVAEKLFNKYICVSSEDDIVEEARGILDVQS